MCILSGWFIEHYTNPHSTLHTHTHMFTYTHALIYTALSSDIRHYWHRKQGAPNSTGDTRVVWSWPTPSNAAVHHQRARYAVWPDTSQTTSRGIRRHEATRIDFDIDTHTCMCNCFFEMTVFVRTKPVEHASKTECAVRAFLTTKFSGVVSR